MSKVIYLNEANEEIKIEVLLSFEVEELKKKFIAYTINDDGVSQNVNVFISEVEMTGDGARVIPIKEDEKEIVLLTYDGIKQTI